MPARQADKRLQNEGCILLAIQALQKDENLSVARAAQLYNVPRTTL
jgi:predicted HTH domain antitoxin